MNDTWDFNISNLRKWHWRRIAPNGDVVGSSPNGYTKRADCEKNARRNGWVPENMIEQDLTNEEEIIQPDSALDEDGSSLENDKSIVGSDQANETAKTYRVKRDSRQRKMLILIASFLGLILIVTVLILFKADQEVESSGTHLLPTGRSHDLPVIARVFRDDVSLRITSGLSELV